MSHSEFIKISNRFPPRPECLFSISSYGENQEMLVGNAFDDGANGGDQTVCRRRAGES